MNPITWLLSLTDHQLNVLATVFGIMASIATVFSVVAANYARLARRDARAARDQTATTEWSDGSMKTVSVAELTHRAEHNTSEVRGEITHMVNQVMHGQVSPRTHGRRRLPTSSIEKQEKSTYE